ncbi:MAG: dihydroxyacetone kinase subunit L [Firmicutes bacterium]|nr:dihydroxyacetone kinase subunit L [Bacillota bacterium]
MVERMAARVAERRAELTELDQPIGDGDHGINLHRGFQAVLAKREALSGQAPGAILKGVAMTLLSTVGGASGPLYGTFFLRMAAAAGDAPSLDAAGLVRAFEAGLAGVKERGKAEPGDKTMVDAWTPAVAAMRERLAAGGGLAEVLAAGAAAAEAGAQATRPMVARRGRASYLGERSAGHQDPGATSSAIILRAMSEVAAEAPAS